MEVEDSVEVEDSEEVDLIKEATIVDEGEEPVTRFTGVPSVKFK